MSAVAEQLQMDLTTLKHILEAALLAAGEPLDLTQMAALFGEEEAPDRSTLREALAELSEDYSERGVELVEVGSGWRLQVRSSMKQWISKLWTERPARYSRALMETLALVAYRQPITRGEIEEVRGVSVSTSIMRTLQEREWVRVVGHRDVPGKPAIFGTTKAFLDYFNLKSLDDLPSLAELRDIENLEPELDLHMPGESGAGSANQGQDQDQDEQQEQNDSDQVLSGEQQDDESSGPEDEAETADKPSDATPSIDERT